jgi:hypothetical protein
LDGVPLGLQPTACGRRSLASTGLRADCSKLGREFPPHQVAEETAAATVGHVLVIDGLVAWLTHHAIPILYCLTDSRSEAIKAGSNFSLMPPSANFLCFTVVSLNELCSFPNSSITNAG